MKKMNRRNWIRMSMCSLLVALTLTSCRDDDTTPEPMNIDGTWELISITDTRAVAIGDEQVEVYVVFQADEPVVTGTRGSKEPVGPVVSTGVFTLYQKLGAGKYRSFDGKWTLTDSTLSGTYSDGKPWGATYEVALEDDGSRLWLAAPTETCVYTKSKLPAGI